MLLMREAKGLSVPALDNRPELFPWLRFYYDAFMMLNRSRGYISTGFDIMASNISQQDIEIYINRKGIVGEERISDFYFYIQTLDDVYISHSRNESKKKSEKAKKDKDKNKQENERRSLGR